MILELVKDRFMKAIFFTVALLSLVLIYFGFSSYPGAKLVYLLFTLISHVLLVLGFTKRALFFDLFIGLFFWIGFWLKLTTRVAFYDSIFSDPVGYFDGSSSSFDHALIVASVGMSGLLLASLIRRNFFAGYLNYRPYFSNSLESIYQKNRLKIWIAFILLIIFVGATNFILAIYQKGTITQTFLPFGLNVLYKWALIFGLASFSAVILDLEFRVKKNVSLIALSGAMFESFFSSVSMLSRGMILNSSSLIYGLLMMFIRSRKRVSLKFLFVAGLIFSIFFLGSMQIVGALRNVSFPDDAKDSLISEIGNVDHLQKAIFIDRWVGIEGVMAVSSYQDIGVKLFKDALAEEYSENDTSFYDKNILPDSPYSKTDKSKHHFLSLPGIIAFLFYPGSYIFLFVAMLCLGGVSAVIEWWNYKLTNNLIFASLISQVVAYRFSNFGYVPSQTYLLFGAIVLTTLVIYLGGKFVSSFLKESS